MGIDSEIIKKLASKRSASNSAEKQDIVMAKPCTSTLLSSKSKNFSGGARRVFAASEDEVEPHHLFQSHISQSTRMYANSYLDDSLLTDDNEYLDNTNYDDEIYDDMMDDEKENVDPNQYSTSVYDNDSVDASLLQADYDIKNDSIDDESLLFNTHSNNNIDNNVLNNSGIFSSATTMTFVTSTSTLGSLPTSPDSIFYSKSNKSTIKTAPKLQILSKSRSNTDDSMKEINLVSSPGEFTTIALTFSNKRSSVLTMHPTIIQTRFDIVSSNQLTEENPTLGLFYYVKLVAE